jgi:isocitrate/isopropylmalate dehydrogenase
MLDHLGEAEPAACLRRAVETCIAEGQLTPDLGGVLTTSEMTEKVMEHLQRSKERI